MPVSRTPYAFAGLLESTLVLKSRSLWFNRLLGVLTAAVLRVWMRTLRIREAVEDPSIHPDFKPACGSVIGSSWHENILVAAWYYGRLKNMAVVVSKSSDGEMISGAAKSLGWKVVRGSSSRGGVGALHAIVAFHRTHSPARPMLTVDGPRGPRRAMKPGAVFAASHTGAPIVPLGMAAERPWRANSWDRLVLPRPGSRVQIYVGSPIVVPPDLPKEAVQDWCDRIVAEMDRCERAAERLLNAPAAPRKRSMATTPPRPAERKTHAA